MVNEWSSSSSARFTLEERVLGTLGLFRTADPARTLRRPQQFLSHNENLKKSLGRAALSPVTILTELYQLLNAPVSIECEASLDGVL